MEIQGQRPMELLWDQESHQMVHQSHHQELPLTESLLALEFHQMEIQGQRPMELLWDQESHQMVHQSHHQELPLTESLLALEFHQMEIQGQRPMELLWDLESHQMGPLYAPMKTTLHQFCFANYLKALKRKREICHLGAQSMMEIHSINQDVHIYLSKREHLYVNFGVN